MSLSYWKNERRDYMIAKNNLTAALNFCSTLFSNIMSVSEALSGVDIGGKGLDNGEFSAQETKVNNIKANIPPMIEYCNEKIDELDKKIDAELARLSANFKTANNTSGSTSSNSNKKPSVGGKLAVTMKE